MTICSLIVPLATMKNISNLKIEENTNSKAIAYMVICNLFL
jgi:uncharacterized protein YkvS